MTRTPRGFALYVGVSERAAGAAGTSIPAVLAAFRARLAEIVPTAHVHARVVYAPTGAVQSDLDVVLDALIAGPDAPGARTPGHRVVIDLSRSEVLLDGARVRMTFREYTLLARLVGDPGSTVSREQLRRALPESEHPLDARSIDTLVRRIRLKLGETGYVIRAARGAGYRFDPHPDVAVVR